MVTRISRWKVCCSKISQAVRWAGQFTEGDTIVFDNPVGDAQLTSPARRPGFQDENFFSESQPTLTSAISRLDRQIAVSLGDRKCWLLSLKNPDVENLDSAFLEHSFARQIDRAGGTASERVSLHIVKFLIRREDNPLRSSRVQLGLQGLGKQRATLAFPGHCSRLHSTLSELSDRGSSREDLVAISVCVTQILSDVAEQGNTDLRKAVENPNSRPVVRLNELDLVLDHWLAWRIYRGNFRCAPHQSAFNA